MISKEKFVEIVEQLREADDVQKKVRKIFEKYSQNYDGMNSGEICIIHEEIVKDLLKNIFDDVENISYYLYECDYGRDTKDRIYINDKPLDISTPEKFYDYLIKNMEDQKQ